MAIECGQFLLCLICFPFQLFFYILVLLLILFFYLRCFFEFFYYIAFVEIWGWFMRTFVIGFTLSFPSLDNFNSDHSLSFSTLFSYEFLLFWLKVDNGVIRLCFSIRCFEYGNWFLIVIFIYVFNWNNDYKLVKEQYRISYNFLLTKYNIAYVRIII